MSQTPEAFPGEMPEPGTLVGQKYRVERFLGAGGMGVVLAATHVHLGERVALKLVRPGPAVDVGAYERLLREARIASRIRSEHVARVFDLGISDLGLPYIAMEFLEGEDLMSRLHARGAMSVAEAVELLLQALEGVAEAHALGVVHRDLKPANLFLTRGSDGSPCVKVLDFGISKIADVDGLEHGTVPLPESSVSSQGAPDSRKGERAHGLLSPATESPVHELTRSRACLGSPRYMAPEQVRSARDVDWRADVWALGAILHELLSGLPPFDGRTFDEVVEKVASREPPALDTLRTDVSRGLADVVERCLRKTKEARFGSVAELASALAPFTPRGEERASRVERILTLGRSVAPSVAPPWQAFDPTLAATAAGDTPRTHSIERAAPRRAARWWWAALLAPAAALVALIVVPRLLAARRARVAHVPPHGTPIVAVFPPRSMGAGDGDWLATALAELVASDLAVSDKIRRVGADQMAQASRDLGHPLDVAPLPADVARLRATTGADYAVTGAVTVGDGPGADRVRLELALVDTSDGSVLARRAATGTIGALFDLVAEAADAIRAELGVSGATPAERLAARASLPTRPEAVRYYAEGVAYRRAHLAAKARDALARAVAAEPDHPLPHAELAGALITLGRDEEARAEAKRALDLSAGLSRERQLNIQWTNMVATKDWSRAADVLRTLHGFFPDELTYGLQYARTTMAAGRPQEGLAILDTLREPGALNTDSPDIDLMEAVIALKLSDFRRAIDAAERARRKAETTGGRTVLAESALHEGDAYGFLGDSARSIEWCEKASKGYLELQDKSRRAGALLCEARGYRNERKDDLVARTTEEALAEARDAGDSYLLGNALNSDGIRLYEAGNRPAARERWEEAAKIYEEIHDREGMGHATGNIATALLDDGDLAHARERFERALALHREVASVAGQRNEIRGLADVDAAAGELAAADHEYADAEKLTEQMGNREELATMWIARARLLRDRGDADGARSLAERARGALVELGDHDDASEAAWLLAEIALDSRRVTDAERLARGALAEVDASSRRGQAGLVFAVLARVAAEEGRSDEAKGFADRGAAALGAAPTVLVSLTTSIDLARARGRLADDRAAQKPVLAELEARAAALGLPGCELDARLAAVTLGFGGAAALARDARVAGFLEIAKRAASR